MCISAAMAGALAAGAGTVATVDQGRQARAQGERAARRAARAEAEAAQRAQAKASMRGKALRENSLFTGGGTAGAAGGTTLGVGG